MKVIKLKPGKEKSLLRRHPWVFDGAIAKGGGDPGETVRIESAEGQFLAWGAVSPTSKIRARVWSFDEKQRIDAAFFRANLSTALSARALFDIKSNGVRLVHGESDGLPGLVVDQYGDTLVAQFLSCGTERWKQTIGDALLELTGLTRLYERSDASVRELEGLPKVSGWLRGEGSTAVVLQEHSWQLALDVAEGHKTGFYLDQRRNHQLFMQEILFRLNSNKCCSEQNSNGGIDENRQSQVYRTWLRNIEGRRVKTISKLWANAAENLTPRNLVVTGFKIM